MKKKTRRLLNIVVGALVMLTAGTPYAYASWSPLVQRMRLWNQGAMSFIGGTANMAYYCSSLVWGLLIDWAPSFNFLPFALILTYAGWFLLSLNAMPAPLLRLSPVGFAACYALVGFGCACTYFSAVAPSVSSFLPSSRGRVVGILVGALGLSGALVAGFFLGVLGAADVSSLFLWIGFFSAAILLVGILCIRRVPPVTRRVDVSGTASGGSDFGGSELQEPLMTGIRSTEPRRPAPMAPAWNEAAPVAVPPPAPGISAAAELSSATAQDAAVFAPLRTGAFWALVGALLLGNGAGLVVINHSGFLVSVQRLESVVVIVCSLCNGCGRLVAGPLSDYLAAWLPERAANTGSALGSSVLGGSRKQRPASRTTLLTAVCVWTALGLVGLSFSVGWDVVVIILCGAVALGYGALFAVVPAIVSIWFGCARFGLTWGTMHALFGIWSLGMNVGCGAIFDATDTYTGAFLVLAFLSLLGGAMSVWLWKIERVREASPM